MAMTATHATDTPVVLFDWGETLMWIPGMVHDPERHLACVERIFDAELRPAIDAAGARLGSGDFVTRYREACGIQIARSRQTRREHRFSERFAMTFELAGIDTRLPPTAYERMADALGREVTAGARLLDHAAEVIAELARWCRLGVVSNYPHGPVVGATLERFGLREHFSVVVVSCDTGWMKPHADCFRPALAALPAFAGRTLMVGDDLTNDVKGAKALGLHTAWIAPGAAAVDPDVDIHITGLNQLPAHCQRLFG